MVIGIVAKNGICCSTRPETQLLASTIRTDSASRASPSAAHRDDALATVAGMLLWLFAIGAGSQMLQTLAIA